MSAADVRLWSKTFSRRLSKLNFANVDHTSIRILQNKYHQVRDVVRPKINDRIVLFFCFLQVIKMLLVVVVMFVASWAPLYIIFARIKLGGELGDWEQHLIPIIAPFAQFLGIANSSVNPILYVFFNHKFRHGFFSLLRTRCKCIFKGDYDAVNTATSSSASLRKSSCRTSRNKSLNRQTSHDRHLACISEGPIGV